MLLFNRNNRLNILMLLTPRNLRITVDNIDYTDIHVNTTMGVSSAITNGLLITTGTVVLAEAPGIELDNRFTNRWNQGHIIEIIEVSTGENIAVAGYTVLDRADYDLVGQNLTLQVTDLLGFYNRVTPANVATCISLENGDTLNNVITNLLTSAGIPIAQIGAINIPGTLKKDIFLTDQESLVRIAGQIAFDNGYELWQNAQGLIISLDQRQHGEVIAGSRLRSNLISLERASGVDSPPTQLIIGGTRLVPPLEVVSNGGFSRISNSNVSYYDGTNGYFRTVDRENRIITSYKFTNGDLSSEAPVAYPANQSGNGRVTLRTETIIETYEQPTFDLRNPANCVPVDEGRILSRETTITEFAGIALEGYFTELARIRTQENIDNGQDPDDPATTVTVADVTPFSRPVTRRVSEEWEYNTPVVIDDVTEFSVPIGGSLEGLVDADVQDDAFSVFYRQIIRETQGAIYPGIADNTLGVDPAQEQGTILIEPFDLVPTLRSTTRSTLAKNRRDWTSQKFTLQNNYRVNPEQTQLAIENGNISLGEISSQIFRLTNTYEFEPPRFSAPSFARFPADEQPTAVPYSFRIDVAAPIPFLGVLPKTYDLTDFTDNKLVGAEVGFLRGKFDHYRYKAANISTDLALFPNGWTPLQGFVEYDERNYRTNYYAIDSMSVSIDASSGSIATFNGLYMGSVSGNLNEPVLSPTAVAGLSDPPACYTGYLSLDGTSLLSHIGSTQNGFLQNIVAYTVTDNGNGTADIEFPNGGTLEDQPIDPKTNRVVYQYYLPTVQIISLSSTAGGTVDPEVPGSGTIGANTQFNFDVLAVNSPIGVTCNSVSVCRVGGTPVAAQLEIICTSAATCTVTGTPIAPVVFGIGQMSGLVAEDNENNDVILYSVDGEILV
jgi:hypothetical protein